MENLEDRALLAAIPAVPVSGALANPAPSPDLAALIAGTLSGQPASLLPTNAAAPPQTVIPGGTKFMIYQWVTRFTPIPGGPIVITQGVDAGYVLVVKSPSGPPELTQPFTAIVAPAKNEIAVALPTPPAPTAPQKLEENVSISSHSIYVFITRFTQNPGEPPIIITGVDAGYVMVVRTPAAPMEASQSIAGILTPPGSGNAESIAAPPQFVVPPAAPTFLTTISS
jgi:hypothetical protein